jgi:short-subunit dehydrogenase
MLEQKPIREQVMVITGASSGIGRATALEAARQGARLVLNSRDAADLEAAAAEIREKCRGATTIVTFAGDVADLAAMQRLAELARQRFGRVDTWVNNAGVSIYGRIEEVPVDEARRLFETNYWGVVHGSLAALPLLRAHGGTLINVGSVLSETAMPLQGHYSASKHAVKGFTDALRIELETEEAPVQVTLIQPAAIDTPYPQHAMNHLATDPTHEPPVYAPEVVARAIVTCAHSPHRNLRVGGSAKMYTVMEKVAPRLADRMKHRSIEAQQSGEPVRDDDTLFAPRPGDARVHGEFRGRVKGTSLYTSAALHPRITGTTLLGLAAVGVGLAIAARRGD